MLDRLREQDGFVRESMKVFVIVIIIFVVMLDANAIFGTRREAGDDAHQAALAAAAVYGETHNDTQAKQEAERALDARGAQLVDFKAEHLADNTYYTVTATRPATTYLFHYFTSFPLVGPWAEKLSHPDVTSNNYSY
jgi:uncharacterized membrane protein